MAMSTNYTLQVNLDATELAQMKNSGYSLCIAKKVNNVYNVVWQGISFLQYNTFQWTEEYAVFGQNTFTNGALVMAGTSIQPLALGESIDLDANGVFQDLGGSPGGGSLTINNNYGSINFGVQAMLGGKYSPIYLDPTQAVTGVETLTPVVSVMVWFDRTLTTSTMFSNSVSQSFEVDYTGITSQTVSYVSDSTTGAGAWIFGDPTSNQGLQYAPYRLYHPLTGQFEDLPFADNHDIMQGLVNKYLSSELGKSVSPPSQFLVQATVTLPPTGDPKEVVSFLKTYLPQGVKADYSIPTDQTSAPTKSIFAKLAWNTLVPMKSLTAGKDDVKKLEKMFTGTLNLYGPGVLSDTFTPLN